MLKDTSKIQISQTFRLINSLTNNEDYRQELWIHYLSGNSHDTFLSHLNYLISNSNKEQEFDLLLRKYGNVLNTLSEFSDFEKAIIVCLLLGLDYKDIANYKNISEIRVKQVISAIRYNPFWTK